MKQKEIRELSTEELVERIQVESSALGSLKMNHSVTQLENPMQIRAKRKDVARMKTELRQRELNA